MRVCREFYFDAAHHLVDYRGKCERVHGHTYKLEVVVSGDVGEDGMVMDFNKLEEIVKKNIIEELDHQDLNEKFDNPTAENIALWIYKNLEKGISIYSIKLWEGKNKWVEVVRE